MSTQRMHRGRWVLATLVLVVLMVLLILPQRAISAPAAQAGNCAGLPGPGGAIAAGTYTMQADCLISASFNLPFNETVTIHGAGYTIYGNSQRVFGVVSTDTTLNIDNMTIRDAGDHVVFVDGGELNATAVRFQDNTHSNWGGALTMQAGHARLVQCVMQENSASDWGGAIYVGWGQLDIVNSTISSNSADDGGGIYIEGGTVNLINSTISGNVAGDGGGIYRNSGAANVSNSIVSGNSTTNCFGAIVDGGGNIEDTDSCGFGDYPNTDPLLGAFTGTHYPLLGGSPAIDAVACGGLVVDQIGTARPQGSACDIGAIELAVADPGGPAPVSLPPGTPPLNTWRATVPEDRAYAWGMADNVYGTIHMEDGAWQYNAGGIPQALVEYGVLLAVDVWEQGGDQHFDHYERICLQGEGRLIFLDATETARTVREILPVAFEDGYTCGWIPNAGMVVLIRPGE